MPGWLDSSARPCVALHRYRHATPARLGLPVLSLLLHFCVSLPPSLDADLPTPELVARLTAEGYTAPPLPVPNLG